ncbi:hypothetical protein OKW42_008334 [Paraburkholderia sp. WC7.3d]
MASIWQSRVVTGHVARNEGQTLRRPCEQGNTLLTVRFAGNATLAVYRLRLFGHALATQAASFISRS